MKQALVGVIFLLAVLGLALPAGAVDLGVRGYYWFPALNGDLRVDSDSIKGTTLDLESDLDYDDEYYPVVEVFVGIGDHHLSASYYRAEYDGTNTLTEEFTFNGETFVANVAFSSSLEYDVYDIAYQYDLLDLENILAGLSLGVVGRVKVFDGEAEIKSSLRSASEDFTVPVPLVGANLHLGILADLLEARLLATGISYGDGSMVDAQADISFTPFPFLDIHGGYRTFFIDVETSDAEFNYNTSGPYAAITLSF